MPQAQTSQNVTCNTTPAQQDNPDDSRRLQLLIQHCTGRQETVESCENLPVSDGYQVAKETLCENFGTPHLIADVHIKKLLRLPSLKNVDGPYLLEFSSNEFGYDINSGPSTETILGRSKGISANLPSTRQRS
ncbi:uncharacterized protein [Pocillopora verrucosa]|uniref:uncharacterized protein n=1 Tax=Pocillopora verrucosa TaxID=203993 RepID=UPI00333F9660